MFVLTIAEQRELVETSDLLIEASPKIVKWLKVNISKVVVDNMAVEVDSFGLQGPRFMLSISVPREKMLELMDLDLVG